MFINLHRNTRGWFFLLLLYLSADYITCETKCFKNNDLGDVTGNVYFCTEDDKPDCCQQDSQFTCCESNSSKTWKEQLQLWGTVAAVIVLIALIFICCKNDLACCNSEETLSQRLGLRKKPDPVMTDINNARLRTPGQCKGSYSSVGGLPPLPPVSPYPERDYNGGRGGPYPSYEGKMATRGRYNSGLVTDDEDYRY